MAQVKVNEIVLPEHYIREGIRGKHVNDLLDVVCLANGVTDHKELIGKKIDWPFPEIEIAKNLTPKPEKPKKKKGEKASKVKGAKTKKWFPFEIIDGGHRWTVAKRLKMKEISAVTKSIDEPGDRFLQQYRTNVGHGLRLDKDARDNAIRILSTVFKKSQKEIVQETGLDVSSISRIISSKQRKEGPRKKAKKRDTEPLAESGKSSIDGMTVAGFLERLQILTDEFPKLSASILAHLVTNVPKSKHDKLKDFAGKVRDIAAVMDDATKPENQAVPAPIPAPVPTSE